jgi:ABC-type antimicrobial peptide transport system permease subunit
MGHVNMVGSYRLLPHDAPDKIRGIEHVAKVEPYLLGMSPTEGHNFGMHVGLNPGDAKRLESHGEAGNPRIIAGRDLAPEDAGKDVALIGQAYARWAGISSETLDNARFVVDLTRSHPVIFPLDRPKRELKIIGIYGSGYVFGDMQLFMPIETFRRIYGVENGFSWLFVTVDSVDNVAFVEQKVREALGGVADIISPKGAATFASTTTRTVDRIAGTVSLFAVALMVVVVFFVMLVTVRERAREIGTLKAIGASDGGIVVQFLAEATALSIVGGLLGMSLFRALGGVGAERLFALSMSPFLPAQYKATLFASLGGVSPGIGPSTLALVLLIAVLVAWVGSGYGVWQVTRLSPLEAMKHE